MKNLTGYLYNHGVNGGLLKHDLKGKTTEKTDRLYYTKIRKFHSTKPTIKEVEKASKNNQNNIQTTE